MERLQPVKDWFLDHIGDRKKTILLGIYSCGLFVIPFIIFSFMCSKTANMGFNIVLTGILNLAYTGGSYHLVKNSRSPIAVGFLIGVSIMFVFLNLMTSIYWGELSNCNVEENGKIAQFSCSTPSAYGAVSAFAALLLTSQLFLSVTVLLWRSDLIDGPVDSTSAPSSGLANGQYDGLPTAHNNI